MYKYNGDGNKMWQPLFRAYTQSLVAPSGITKDEILRAAKDISASNSALYNRRQCAATVGTVAVASPRYNPTDYVMLKYLSECIRET